MTATLPMANPPMRPKSVLTPEQAIAGIHEAGGVAIWAHPPHRQRLSLNELEARLRDWARWGLDGLEVFYSQYTPEEAAVGRRPCKTAMDSSAPAAAIPTAAASRRCVWASLTPVALCADAVLGTTQRTPGQDSSRTQLMKSSIVTVKPGKKIRLRDIDPDDTGGYNV